MTGLNLSINTSPAAVLERGKKKRIVDARAGSIMKLTKGRRGVEGYR